MLAVTAEATPLELQGKNLTENTIWDVLDRFGQQLQLCDQTNSQIRLLLGSLQEALEADGLFWYPGQSSDPLEFVGGSDEGKLSRMWCEEFAKRVLGEESSDSSEMLHSFLDPASKPFQPWPTSAALTRMSRSRNSWVVAVRFGAAESFEEKDLKVMQLARRMLLNHRQQAQVYERLRESLFGLVRCLTAAIDAKDPFTWGHSERVGRIAVRIGKQMQLPPAMLSDLYLAGLLHDIGKIGIRDSVLQKAGALTDEEYAHIKEHAAIGDRLVSNIKTLQHLRPGIRSHHERFDGKGYPDGLVGEDIPILARILAVSDACDAMMAARPYRTPLPTEKIDGIMRGGAGTQWDPHVIEQFLSCREDLYSICQRGLGDSVFTAVERALRAGQTAEQSSLMGGSLSSKVRS